MIMQPSNVELTKIHYYEKNIPCNTKSVSINTISRDVPDNSLNRNVIIKKNIFGHRWVLKINENDEEIKQKSKVKLFVYIFVFFSITVAVAFGIFLTLDKTIFRKEKTIKIYSEDIGIRNRPLPEPINVTSNYDDDYSTSIDTNKTFLYQTTRIPEKKPYCNNCTLKDVCMKLNDTSKPECVTAIDAFDPTGCGGLCRINVEFCQLLSQSHQVYQCSPRKMTLNCNDGQFNCENMCISEEKRCDGTIDCSNRLDEENCVCDDLTHFQCGEKTSCLPKSYRCDKTINCWDGSDEKNCYYQHLCYSEEYHCNDGFCIGLERLCDGIADCSDKSDEPEGCND